MSDTLERIASRIGVELDGTTRDQVADEQVGMVWGHVTVGAIAATVFALIMAYHLRAHVPGEAIQIWLVAKILVVLPRVVYAQLFHRQGFPGGAGWRQTTYWLLAIDGAVWGVAGYWLMHFDIDTASLVTASLCCIACVATFGLQAKVAATAAYVAPIIVPMALGMLLRADAFGAYGAVGLGLFLGQLLVSAHRSDAKFSETVLLRMHAARISEERTRALELAERESSVKSQFLGTVSHELRTPIHGMLGIARLVHSESPDPLTRKRMELVESSGTHLLGLVTDLIDVSRVASGQLRVQELVFDLMSEVERVADIYTVRSAEKGLTFTLDTQIDGPAWFIGDPVRTRQVLHNLIGNAIKFTQKGWIHLMVAPGEQLGEIVFEVRDTGVGISEDDQRLVFDAFRQVGNRSGSRREGTGLGLTIAREIARLLGGDISLSSRPGFGSIFRFTVRFEPASAPARLEADDPILGKDVPVGARVLLAEDNDVNALIAGSMLANDGHQVERVDDGAEAVRRALREIDRPDIVLMDCMMPTMDGFEATRSIRHQEAALGLRRIPIIALSAIVDDDSGKRSIDAGMDDALGKPFSAEQLRKTILPWLARARAAASQAAAMTPSGDGERQR